ncbi:MAG: esterase family protein [Bifidobacteriaceae bacterium]|jgi:S-formylglutathione hydrolase FrmB|nr:esterase family protein [Bifidobacteriaceae bacterium]
MGNGLAAASAAQAWAADFVEHDLLSSMPFGVGLAGAGLVVIAVAMFALSKKRRRVRGRRTWRSLSYVAGTLALIIGLACSVNAYVGWAPSLEAALVRAGISNGDRPTAAAPKHAPPADQMGDGPLAGPDTPVATTADTPEGLNPAANQADRGAIGKFTLPIPDNLNIPGKEIQIYTPPGYDPTGKIAYPVLYLIHGSPGSAADWFASGAGGVADSLIAQRKLAPAIIVSPSFHARDVSDSGCLDSTKPGGSKVETYLHKVVLPWVESHFPVATSRQYSAIGGMSMGGYCSIDQGLRHAQSFATILSILPYGAPGKAGEAMKSSKAEIDAVTPLHYLPTLTTLKQYPVATWFAVDDAELTKEVGLDADKMAKQLEALGQVAKVYVDHGRGHTWAMTIESLPAGLEFWQSRMEAAAKG